MANDSLQLSVVVVAGDQRERVEACLRSVFEQDVIDRCEVILVDCGRSERPWDGPYSSRSHVIKMTPGSHYGDALAAGALAARAPVVAFIEEHIVTHPSWARALIEIHQGDCAAAACEVHVGNPGVGLGDGWGMIGYGAWYPPLPPGETKFLHGYNSSCRRDVLLSYGDRLATLILADTAFAPRLRKDGHKLVNCPAAKVSHMNETTLFEPLLKNFLAHRFSGHVRAKECGWSWQLRLMHICGWPLMPFYGLYCTLKHLTKHRPALLPHLARYWPLWFIGQWVAGFATAVGLVFGPGKSAVRFTQIELNGHRPEAPPRPATNAAQGDSQEPATIPMSTTSQHTTEPSQRRAA